MRDTTDQTLFAAWLAENRPDLFNALARASGAQTGQPMKLEGFTDILASIGSGISSAARSVASGLSTTVKGVGNFLASSSGQSALARLGTAYVAIKTAPEAAALQAQVDRANAGLAPAPIEMTWDASRQQYVPVYQGQPLSVGQARSLGSSLTTYLPWIVGGLAAVFLLFNLTRRSR